MPLSEQEQRLLEEMERGLYHNDADFVANVGGSSLRPNYRSISLGVLAAVAGIGGLIAGVAIQQLWLGVLGFIIMFAGVLIATTPSKSALRTSASAPRSRPNQQRSSERGFMDRMNERWDRRQDGQQ